MMCDIMIASESAVRTTRDYFGCDPWLWRDTEIDQSHWQGQGDGDGAQRQHD